MFKNFYSICLKTSIFLCLIFFTLFLNDFKSGSMNILDFINPMRKNRTLIGKPKVKKFISSFDLFNFSQLFFVQACRGHDYMEGWRGRAGAQVTQEAKPFRTPRTWPVDADVLVHYATTGSFKKVSDFFCKKFFQKFFSVIFFKFYF